MYIEREESGEKRGARRENGEEEERMEERKENGGERGWGIKSHLNTTLTEL